MNSYELGISTSLIFPRVVFPRMGDREYDFPATTTFRLYADQMNRAKYYKLLAFGGNVTYDFQPKSTSRHSITPFRLTFNVLRNPTAAFDTLRAENPALYVSLRDQFIPAMEYTYTYDNASVRGKRNPIWWQTTVASAGNLTSAVYRISASRSVRKERSFSGYLCTVPEAELGIQVPLPDRQEPNDSLAYCRRGDMVVWQRYDRTLYGTVLYRRCQ